MGPPPPPLCYRVGSAACLIPESEFDPLPPFRNHPGIRACVRLYRRGQWENAIHVRSIHPALAMQKDRKRVSVAHGCKKLSFYSSRGSGGWRKKAGGGQSPPACQMIGNRPSLISTFFEKLVMDPPLLLFLPPFDLVGGGKRRMELPPPNPRLNDTHATCSFSFSEAETQFSHN